MYDGFWSGCLRMKVSFILMCGVMKCLIVMLLLVLKNMLFISGV